MRQKFRERGIASQGGEAAAQEIDDLRQQRQVRTQGPVRDADETRDLRGHAGADQAGGVFLGLRGTNTATSVRAMAMMGPETSCMAR